VGWGGGVGRGAGGTVGVGVSVRRGGGRWGVLDEWSQHWLVRGRSELPCGPVGRPGRAQLGGPAIGETRKGGPGTAAGREGVVEGCGITCRRVVAEKP